MQNFRALGALPPDSQNSTSLQISSYAPVILLQLPSKSKTPAGTVPIRRVARNSQWGAVLGVWGRSPQPPEAKGVRGRRFGGLGAKPTAA